MTLLAPTFGPIHWFSLTDVIGSSRTNGARLVAALPAELEPSRMERRLESIREAFLPEHFLEFSTSVRTGYLSMGPSGRPTWGEFEWDELE